MNDLINKIISEGQKTIIDEEPVLGGLTRPLKIQFETDEGIVIETWEYPPNTAMERWWGAINGVSRILIEKNKEL